jgi:benzoyl-CoA reductase/2-hydroxyglutaryl-CoA dehydratase subunit BcrC/BadD/HgdB
LHYIFLGKIILLLLLYALIGIIQALVYYFLWVSVYNNNGLILFMQQFCDPEEMEYPYLKQVLDRAGVPHIKLGIDQQMRDFGQARTAIQAFADMMEFV